MEPLADVRVDYPKADFVKAPNGNKLIFNMGGNEYRLTRGIEFDKPFMPTLSVCTHAPYDRLIVKDL